MRSESTLPDEANLWIGELGNSDDDSDVDLPNEVSDDEVDLVKELVDTLVDEMVLDGENSEADGDVGLAKEVLKAVVETVLDDENSEADGAVGLAKEVLKTAVVEMVLDDVEKAGNVVEEYDRADDDLGSTSISAES